MFFYLGEVKSLKQTEKMENKENTVSKNFSSSHDRIVLVAKRTNTSFFVAGCWWCRRRHPGLNEEQRSISSTYLNQCFSFGLNDLFKVHSWKAFASLFLKFGLKDINKYFYLLAF